MLTGGNKRLKQGFSKKLQYIKLHQYAQMAGLNSAYIPLFIFSGTHIKLRMETDKKTLTQHFAVKHELKSLTGPDMSQQPTYLLLG